MKKLFFIFIAVSILMILPKKYHMEDLKNDLGLVTVGDSHYFKSNTKTNFKIMFDRKNKYSGIKMESLLKKKKKVFEEKLHFSSKKIQNVNMRNNITLKEKQTLSIETRDKTNISCLGSNELKIVSIIPEPAEPIYKVLWKCLWNNIIKWIINLGIIIINILIWGCRLFGSVSEYILFL